MRTRGVRGCGMRAGISLSVTAADVDRLRALVKDRNAPQKQVWRARIVMLSAQGLGTNAIMREIGKSKTCVWRWQERFAAEGVDGLLHDKTRPSRIAKLNPSLAERVVALTMEAPASEETHWTGAAMAKATGSASPRSSASGARTGSSRIASDSSNCPTTRASSTNCATSSGSMSIRPHTPLSCRSTKRARFRRLTALSPDCR